MRWLSRLVSVAVVLVVMTLAWLWMRSRVPDLSVGQDFATYAKFRFEVELVNCEAVLNYVRNSMTQRGKPLEWEARRVSHRDDQDSTCAELRQRCVYHAEGP